MIALPSGYPRSCEFAPSNVSWTVEPNLKPVVSALASGDNPSSNRGCGKLQDFLTTKPLFHQTWTCSISHPVSCISCISLKRTACCLKSGLRSILLFYRKRRSRVEETNQPLLQPQAATDPPTVQLEQC